MRLILPLLSLSVLALPLSAAAQERPKRIAPEDQGWSADLGAAALFSPNYLGDDEYSLSAVPFIQVQYADKFSASVQNGVKYKLIDTDGFSAGPLARLDFGREEDGSAPFRISGDRTTDLLGLGDIDTTVSLGGYAEYKADDITFSATLGQAVSGHEGLTGDIGVSYRKTLMGFGPPLFISAGPQISFGDTTYMNANFGVNAAQSTASGLTAYEAGGGITSYGLSSVVIMPLSQNAAVTLIGNYSRLTGDAADSPLVKTRGSADQAFIGFVTSYRIQ